MEINIFEEKKEVNGKKTLKYFYTYYDDISRKKITRVCRDCKTKKDAEVFVSKLKFLSDNQYLIRNITKDMYVLGKDHYLRLEKFGRKISEKTRQQKIQILREIDKQFGDCYINTITVSKIESFLIDDKHSGSWKNFYLETFGNIYDETNWKCTKPVPKPHFQRFIRNSKKSDLLTTKEINRLFKVEVWENEKHYLLFLLILSCGLRLGEAIGVKVNQIDFDKKFLIINGFCRYDGTKTNYNKKGSNENRKLRISPIPEDMLNKLKGFILQQNLDIDDFLFTDDNKKVYAQAHLRYYFHRALKKANIDEKERKITPHSLRYIYVTRMRRLLSVEQVQKIVGHTTVDMTEYYTRFGIEEMYESIKDSFKAADTLFE